MYMSHHLASWQRQFSTAAGKVDEEGWMPTNVAENVVVLRLFPGQENSFGYKNSKRACEQYI